MMVASLTIWVWDVIPMIICTKIVSIYFHQYGYHWITKVEGTNVLLVSESQKFEVTLVPSLHGGCTCLSV